MASIRTWFQASTMVEVLVSMTIISTVIVLTFMIINSAISSNLIALRLVVSDEISRILTEEKTNIKIHAVRKEYESFYLETASECYSVDCRIRVIIVRAFTGSGRLIQEARQLVDTSNEVTVIGDESYELY